MRWWPWRQVTVLRGTRRLEQARAFAHASGRRLRLVDLKDVESKYLEETEKNLKRLFTEAEASGVVLFFDEAEELFAGRSTRKLLTSSSHFVLLGKDEP
jgi:SpoVK/Ycf46/Vps4 family AAA+-type ATPase